MVRRLAGIIYCKTVAGLEVFQLFDMPRGAYITPVAAGGGALSDSAPRRRSFCADNCVRLSCAQDLCRKYVHHPSSEISLIRTYISALAPEQPTVNLVINALYTASATSART